MIPRIYTILFLASTFALISPANAQRGRGGNPFAAPNAKLQYAPDRDYDLQNLAVELKVDYPKLAFEGVATNNFAPLRDGLSTVRLDCGTNLKVSRCEVNGRPAEFERVDDQLRIKTAAPLVRGKVATVTVHYSEVSGTPCQFQIQSITTRN